MWLIGDGHDLKASANVAIASSEIGHELRFPVVESALGNAGSIIVFSAVRNRPHHVHDRRAECFQRPENRSPASSGPQWLPMAMT
jgi:hypothetical protein